MAVEDSNGRPEGQNAKFPIGMSVLAVDDDPVCLKILEKYLHICKYKVTATNEGRTALEMLRQNKHVYDLLIVNVHMPDIDGFKLLELVGLELDLPVIMLSANGEIDTVMRGIKHGACDYLLKPVGLKEISVVWKHVVMRRSKKRNNNSNNNNNIIIPNNTIGTGVLVANARLVINNNNNSGSTRSINNNNRNGHKRRVLEEEFVDDEESDEPLKKQRVIWSPDLHRKFVEAINDLGIDKAVPKKILEKMSVDELTRENVASHLQKYRLYLKRMKEMPIQHANLLQAGFGSRNSQYIHLTSLESFKNYHVSGRYRQYIPATSSGYSTNRSTATSASSLPNLIPTPIPSGGYGTNVSNNNNNGTMGSNYNNINNINGVNNVNNQPSMFVAGTATSTYSFQYTQTQSNNGINYNYPSLPVPPAAQITNLPFGASHISPMVMGTNGNLTGQNYTSGTGDELQQVVASFNNNMHNNHNNSALNSNFSALFNPIANMNNSYVPVGTNGEMGFGPGNVTGTGGLVPDQLSSSNNGSGLDNVDDLLAILKPMDGSGEAPFMDDMLPN